MALVPLYIIHLKLKIENKELRTLCEMIIVYICKMKNEPCLINLFLKFLALLTAAKQRIRKNKEKID